MDISEQTKLEIAKLALDYLVSIQANKADNQMELLIRQTGTSNEETTFQHVFNALYDTIGYKVSEDIRKPIPPYSYS